MTDSIFLIKTSEPVFIKDFWGISMAVVPIVQVELFRYLEGDELEGKMHLLKNSDSRLLRSTGSESFEVVEKAFSGSHSISVPSTEWREVRGAERWIQPSRNVRYYIAKSRVSIYQLESLGETMARDRLGTEE